LIKNSNRHSTKGSIKSGTKNSSRSKKPYTPKPNVNGALKDFTDGAIEEGVPEELKRSTESNKENKSKGKA